MQPEPILAGPILRLEAEELGCRPSLCCVTLRKPISFLNLSFPHLYDGAYLLEWKVNRLLHVELQISLLILCVTTLRGNSQVLRKN